MIRNFIPFLLLLITLHSYCQDSSKVIVCLGYESLEPLNKMSDFFSFKKIKKTTEIKSGNGIIGTLFYYNGSNIIPYLRTGYFWHKKLYGDTLVNSIKYSDMVYYRNIPLIAGIEILTFRIRNHNLYFNLDVSYNLITRYYSIPDINESSNSSLNGIGYSLGITPYFKNLHVHWGIGKKSDFNFVFLNINIPFYPFWFLGMS